MSKDLTACFSSKDIHWATPSKLYKAFMAQGFLDPCPLCANFDGLQRDYENKKIFINPPFKDLDKWCDWAIKQFLNNNIVVILMPARTDTIYFHKLCEYDPRIIFIKGRLKFNDSNGAPFPTILVKLGSSTIIDYHSWGNFTYDELLKDLGYYE